MTDETNDIIDTIYEKNVLIQPQNSSNKGFRKSPKANIKFLTNQNLLVVEKY